MKFLLPFCSCNKTWITDINVITRFLIVSKVLSRDIPNTKLKFLVPLSIALRRKGLHEYRRPLYRNTTWVAGNKSANQVEHLRKPMQLVLFFMYWFILMIVSFRVTETQN